MYQVQIFCLHYKIHVRKLYKFLRGFLNYVCQDLHTDNVFFDKTLKKTVQVLDKKKESMYYIVGLCCALANVIICRENYQERTFKMDNRDNKKETDGEIDLLQIGRVVLAKIWIVIISAIATGLVALILTETLVTPMYQSTSKLYVINRQNDNTTTYSDIQSSSQLIKDYKVLVTSIPVVDKVIENLGLDMSQDELIKEISCDVEIDSRVLNLTVTDKDPYMAKKIVDAVADVSSKQIPSIMKIEGINIIEYGRVPTQKSTPNTKKNTVLGVLAGFLVSLFIIIVRYVLDDSIKNADDVEKYLGMSTLSLIPLTKSEYNGRSSTKRKKGFGRKRG